MVLLSVAFVAERATNFQMLLSRPNMLKTVLTLLMKY